MKKIFSTIAMAVALFLATPAQAGVNFGVRAGANLTNISSGLHHDNRTGFYVGPTLKFTLPVVGLGVDASALYDQREAKVEGYSIKSQSIAIPLNLRYSVGLGSTANIFAFAGPQFAFNVGGDKEFDGNKNWTLRSSNLSVNLGVGATVMSHLELKVNYNIACGKTGEAKVKNAMDYYNCKFNSWQLGLAYYF